MSRCYRLDAVTRAATAALFVISVATVDTQVAGPTIGRPPGFGRRSSEAGAGAHAGLRLVLADVRRLCGGRSASGGGARASCRPGLRVREAFQAGRAARESPDRGQLRARRSSAQRERACRWGSPAAASSRTARRTAPEAASPAITAGSSSHAASMTAGPARRTSRTATSDGVNPWSSRPTGRCVKRTPGQGVGTRVGTAARYVEGTCDVRPNQYAAATPAGPEPGPPSARATSSTRGGDMPIVVIAPFQ